GVGEAARLFGDNDNNNVGEVSTLVKSSGRLIGGHSSLMQIATSTSSSQTKENDKGEGHHPSTTPIYQYPIFQNALDIFQDSHLRSQNQLSSTNLPEKLSMENAWQNVSQNYYHAPAAEIKTQTGRPLPQQHSGQNQIPSLQQQRQSNTGFSFASPIDQRPNNAFLTDIGQDFYLYQSELNAPPTPISISSSPSAGPLMPVFNSFDPNDEDMVDSSSHFFPPLTSIQRRPITSSSRDASRVSTDDAILEEEF
ncbi:2644_t:CDS:2, partial [Acaulospora morrowiae]